VAPVNFKDKTGQRFGKLVALRRVGNDCHRNAVWECRCDCGRCVEIRSNSLASGRSKSCGCWSGARGKHNRKHGHATKGAESSEYRSWLNMLTRCRCPSKHNYKNYGGRGISVCERWQNSFENFFADMGPKPSPDHTIDRVDPNGNYEKSNCRWSTPSEQRRNQRPLSIEACAKISEARSAGQRRRWSAWCAERVHR
jgi:hypothetical protein